LANDANFFAMEKNIRTGSKRGHGRGERNDILFPERGELMHCTGEVKDIPRTRCLAAPACFVSFTSEQDGKALSLAGRSEHTSALEESDGFRALIKIAAEGGEESGNETVAELRLVVAERIFQGNGVAEMRDIGSGHERAGAGLVETHTSQIATKIHREIVGGIGIRACGEGALGKRWNFFDSNNAGDFLDEVGFAAEFTTVAGDAPTGLFTGSQFFKADTGEGGFDFGIREGDAQQIAHTGVSQGNLAAFRAFA
jgi:hypothetical protein